MAEIEIFDDDDLDERVCNLISADREIFSRDMIYSFDFKGLSEMAVKKAVPKWEEILTGEDEVRIELLKTCVVFQTAINLSPYVKKEQVKVQQTTHAKIEYFESTAYDILIEGLSERLAMMYLELNCEDFNGFSCLAITNPYKRYNGSGFDAPL